MPADRQHSQVLQIPEYTVMSLRSAVTLLMGASLLAASAQAAPLSHNLDGVHTAAAAMQRSTPPVRQALFRYDMPDSAPSSPGPTDPNGPWR